MLWTGATVSILGDGMSFVALVWLAYELRGSPADIGWLAFWYSAPVIVGGLAAGVVLDRFDGRAVLIVDSVLRGAVMASVPLLHVLGALPAWYIFVAAAVYGLLKMVPLAGVPALIPSVVDHDDLSTANALESISYGVGGIVGPALAGVLIAGVGAPAVIAIDAASYLAFAACVALMRRPARASPPVGDATTTPVRGLRPAVRLFFGVPAILMTTLMFMAFNIGNGVFGVLLPVYVVDVLGSDAALYGAVLGVASAGLLAGSVVTGAVATPRRIGRWIAATQALAGVLVVGFLLRPSYPVLLAITAAFGLAASPLTIWAQTLRMQLIPPELRGRVFALLRTLMQSTPPLGGLAAGLVLSGGGLDVAVLAAAAFIAVPGVVGLVHPALEGEWFGPRAEQPPPEVAEPVR